MKSNINITKENDDVSLVQTSSFCIDVKGVESEKGESQETVIHGRA